MSTHPKLTSRSSATLAVLFFLPPLILFIAWSFMGLGHGTMSEAQRVQTFLGYFPDWMNSMAGIHIIALVLCIVAMVLASRSFKKRVLSIRVTMLIVVICAIFLIIFNIYQIMVA